jgi:hypothetical protein
MSNLLAELRTIHEELASMTQVFDKSEILKPLESLEVSANKIGEAGVEFGPDNGKPVSYSSING